MHIYRFNYYKANAAKLNGVILLKAFTEFLCLKK